MSRDEEPGGGHAGVQWTVVDDGALAIGILGIVAPPRGQQGTSKFGNGDQAVRCKVSHAHKWLQAQRNKPCQSSPNKEVQVTNVKDAATSRIAPLHTPTDLRSTAVPDLAVALNVLLADMFALYLKTKNFHWHM